MATRKRPKKICSAFGEKTFFAMAIDPAADKIPILIYSAKMTDSDISLLIRNRHYGRAFFDAQRTS